MVGILDLYDKIPELKLYGSSPWDVMVATWLYSPYDEEKIRTFQTLYSIRPIQLYLDYWLDKRYDEEYLRRNQMTYNDVRDPRKLKQVSSGSQLTGYALNFVSNNLEKLYK